MKSSRSRVALATLFAVVGSFMLATSALASVTQTLSVDLTNKQLGAHSDTLINLTFDYGSPDPALYPDGNWRESVKDLIVDIPQGLVGNPNAIPYAERCDPAQFETGLCPLSSDIGTVQVRAVQLPSETEFNEYGVTPGDGYTVATLGPTNNPARTTRLSLLRTDPEVPALIGIYVPPLLAGVSPVRQTIRVTPDTGSDLKLRTTTPGGVTHLLPHLNNPNEAEADKNFLRVDFIRMRLLGTLANGNNFMTNPTSCEPWQSTAYANAYFDNNNVDADPLRIGANTFHAATSTPITPDCSNVGSIPFPISGATKISTKARDVSPEFDFTITEPGIFQNGQVSSTVKRVVTTVPASINVDVQQLGRVCENDAFIADKCAASTRVGTVAIETPLLLAGLTGDVYLTRNPKEVLPDLGMHIRGAINFTQRGSNKYVGVKGNQIQTTFDNIPAVGFSKLNVHLFGGPNGLLRSLKCPTSNKQPQDGSFDYSFTAYSGATNASTTDLSGTPCFGIQNLRTFQCVYRVLRFQPTYTSRARIKKVVLFVDGKKVTTVSTGKFQFRVPAKKFKKGKHRFELRATYDDGTVSKKKSRFTRC